MRTLMNMRLRIVDNPITTGVGVLIFIVGAILFGLNKLTWDQFLILIGISGIGVLLKDPKKPE